MPVPSVPDIFEEVRSCLWKAWDVFCGLEPLPGPRLAPEEAVMQKMECGDTEGTQHSATSEGTEKRDMLEGTKLRDMPEISHWRKGPNVCGFLLVSLTVLCHFYFS